MNNHVIICGFGRVGFQVANDLKAYNTDLVVLEKDESVIEKNDGAGHVVFLRGDSTDDIILENAGIKNAKAIITCLPKDADNIYVVLAAREFNKNILIVSRASRNLAVSKLKMAGANNVIMPDSIGGSHMASLIANPDVMEFLDIIRTKGVEGANIESISYDELPPEFQDKSIKELESRDITGATIIGFKEAEGNYLINPDVDIKVVKGSRIFILGNDAQIKKLVDYFNLTH